MATATPPEPLALLTRKPELATAGRRNVPVTARATNRASSRRFVAGAGRHLRDVGLVGLQVHAIPPQSSAPLARLDAHTWVSDHVGHRPPLGEFFQ